MTGPTTEPYARQVFTEARLTGDLVLEYADLGDPDGGAGHCIEPGSPSTAGGGALLDEAARRHGLRLVSVSRPGYGASTPTPPGLASVGRQVLKLADLLGLPTFGTFGSSGGGPFALATAAVAPDRVTRVVVAAGSGMPDEGDDLAEASTVIAEVREFAEGLRGLDAFAFRAAMSGQHAAQRDVLRRPPEGATFFADLARALDPPDGFARDNLSWGAPWDIDVTSVALPRRPVLRRGRPDGASHRGGRGWPACCPTPR